ncbi:MAG: class I SAM-dependent methyltransferase, partial [Actinomycetota bacterium]|nr:class I SAM-dependent methyltransferase [Actinomycetota bacterium]
MTTGDWQNRWRETNKASWDERVPIHVGGEFYGVEGFRAGEEHLRPFELEEMGDVSGKELLHLQCHFGKDTLSWARHGARVTGLDFSAPAVEAAGKLAAEIGIEAEFVRSDVYEANEALGGRTFDVVYTGLGALNWLPDITRWAGVVAGLVRPGGFLYLAEFHPFANVFGDDDLTVEHDYFHTE